MGNKRQTTPDTNLKIKDILAFRAEPSHRKEKKKKKKKKHGNGGEGLRRGGGGRGTEDETDSLAA